MCWAAIIRFRMMLALGGIVTLTASSIHFTDEAMCTYVQTPQDRCVISGASLGSRPLRMISRPRNSMPELQAFLTLPPSTSTSIRK